MCPVIIPERFFIALFSALEETPCVSCAFYHRSLTWHKVITHSFFKLWLHTQNHTGTKRVNAKMTNSSKTRRRARKKNWKQRTRLTQAKRKKTQQIKHWTAHSWQTPTHTHTQTICWQETKCLPDFPEEVGRGSDWEYCGCGGASLTELRVEGRAPPWGSGVRGILGLEPNACLYSWTLKTGGHCSSHLVLHSAAEQLKLLSFS